jgi:NAD(P)-dependent dehydrogenase (short-subunit alcohol dehydrogenase family)
LLDVGCFVEYGGMEGKVAIVTGAGAGIGRAVAVRLAREGLDVVVVDLDGDGGEETVRLVEEGGGRGGFFRADVTVEDEVQEMVGFAETRFGGLDVLVNNAGGAPGPHFPEAGATHWGRTIDLNLRGVMLCIQAVLPAMRGRGGGVIVNVSSMAGIGSRSYAMPEYAASKAAVVRLTSALGYLKQESGVRVNCICPGWVGTPAVRRALANMTQEERAAQSMPPPDVPIRPEQIGDAVVEFVRDDALAGRVMLWPDGEEPRLIPGDSAVDPDGPWTR